MYEYAFIQLWMTLCKWSHARIHFVCLTFINSKWGVFANNFEWVTGIVKSLSRTVASVRVERLGCLAFVCKWWWAGAHFENVYFLFCVSVIVERLVNLWSTIWMLQIFVQWELKGVGGFLKKSNGSKRLAIIHMNSLVYIHVHSHTSLAITILQPTLRPSLSHHLCCVC